MILKDDGFRRELRRERDNLYSDFPLARLVGRWEIQGFVVSWLLLLLKWWEDLLFIGHKQGIRQLSVRKIS